MGVFDKVLKEGESLIKNEQALDYDYLPKILPFREKEQRRMATCMKPLFNNNSGSSMFIHGPPGIGKTAAIKHVLKELEEETDEIYPIYVNCWHKNTTYKVLMDICDQIDFAFTQNKNSSELMNVIAKIINKKKAVFVFDEVDKAEDIDFLYFLAEDIRKKSIFLITNYKEWLDDIDERLKSRLVPERLEFKQYNKKETKEILKQRRDYAFVKNVWKEESFQIVVDKTAELKDIRTGLFLMKESARQAENRSSKKIEKKDANNSASKLDEFTIKEVEELDEDSQKILKIVRNNSGKKIGDLYDIYKDKGGSISYKTFQRRISSLDEGKFISVKKKTGTGGNTTIVNKRLTDY